MTFTGILTPFLKPEHIAKGYSLFEDEHFLYVRHSDRTIATFSNHRPDINKVYEFIEKNERS